MFARKPALFAALVALLGVGAYTASPRAHIRTKRFVERDPDGFCAISHKKVRNCKCRKHRR